MTKLTFAVLAGFVLAVGWMVAVGAALGGCAASSQVVKQAEVATYAAEELQCVQSAKAHDSGLAGAETCIAVIRSRWCGDGGQLAGYCVGQDGGAR